MMAEQNSPGDAVDRAQAVKQKYEHELMSYPGVVGVGIGLRSQGGALGEEICIVVMVREKRPASALSPDELLPTTLDGVPVDVQETGVLRAHR
jgi:hypothetical protein